ncbi:hypothetical protein NMG60_11032605 [Bertholletia excelsa]
MPSGDSGEPATSDSQSNYDAFLIFKGDVKHFSFVSHLCRALVDSGLRTFGEDDGVQRKENMKVEIERVIKGSKVPIVVVVLSEDYASSIWCLDELVMILEIKKISGLVVLPVFYNVDPSDVRKQTGRFGEAFAKYEGNEWRGKVDGWRAALKEVADLAGMSLWNQAHGLVKPSSFLVIIFSKYEVEVGRTIDRRTFLKTGEDYL